MNKTYYEDLINRCDKCKELDFALYLISVENFVVSKSSSKKTTVLKDPLSGYHYIIKNNPLKNSQYQAYITEDVLPDGTTNFRKKHFTIIDFVQMRYRIESLGEAVVHIEKKAGILAPIASIAAPRSKSSNHAKRPANLNLLKPYTDTHYLAQLRKIEPSILNELHIKNSLRNIRVKTHNNTAFPMKNLNGEIITWCEKNAVPQPDGSLKSWQSFPENSTTGLLFVTGKPAFTRYVLFSETPVDAISYYQVNHELLKDSTLIVSSCGNINPEMLTHLKHLLQESPQAKLIVANDFDAAGFRFDFMIASTCGGQYSFSNSITPIFHPIQPSAGNHSYFKCTFLSVDDDALNVYRNSVELFSMQKQLPYQVSAIEDIMVGQEKQRSFSIQFSFNLRHSKLLLNHYCDYFRLHPKLLFDKPSRGQKDWNEVVLAGKYEPTAQLRSFLLNPYMNTIQESILQQPSDEEKKKTISR